jgi:AcrR family transcriptional regulator
VTQRARDPRSIRTVEALRAALRGALDARALDEVTVSDICRRAGIQRTTFYTHYASVPELLTRMLTAEIEQLLTLPDPAELTGLSIGDLSAEFQRTLAAAFEVVTADRHLYRVGFESSASGLMRRALAAMLLRRVETAITIWHLHGQALDVDIDVAAPFAAGGLAASVESWALSEETDSGRWAATVRDQMAPWWPRG